jgi:hypothetical protein
LVNQDNIPILLILLHTQRVYFVHHTRPAGVVKRFGKALGIASLHAPELTWVAERPIIHEMSMEQNISDGAGIPLTDADIQEFIEIYKQEFKEDLSIVDARAMASGVLELYYLLAQQLPDKKDASGTSDSTPPIPKS